MIKTVSIPIYIDIQKVDYQNIVVIDLKDVPISDWCGCLSLLKAGLVNTLLFVGNSRLKVEIEGSLPRSTRAQVVVSSDQVGLTFHPDEFDFLWRFFLKYYRDSVAEVDHIDIEAMTVPEQSKEAEEVYVTFQVKDYVPPMSAKEMRRLLDATE